MLPIVSGLQRTLQRERNEAELDFLERVLIPYIYRLNIANTHYLRFINI